MKKVLLIALAITLVAASAAMAAVVGSDHDLSATALDSGGSTSQVCVFCHHPHRGTSTVSEDLLWNINDSTATYPTYAATDTTTSGVDGSNISKPQSLLCMGCHDGDGADNQFINKVADNTAYTLADNLSGVTSLLGTSANLGETLVDDHPMGMIYDVVSAGAGDLETAIGTTGPSGYEVTGDSGDIYPLYGGGSGVGTMECSTCHDVHAGDNGVTNTSQDANIQFMRGDMAASAMCIDCHTSK